jgi:hypothetical protein
MLTGVGVIAATAFNAGLLVTGPDTQNPVRVTVLYSAAALYLLIWRFISSTEHLIVLLLPADLQLQSCDGLRALENSDDQQGVLAA